ncbi:MAG: hypothetical protein C0601_05820 [Candidatus Muiribacterium halophilum]|uniref:DUF327 domain-containing protein n=1 Tax=Muiribacterium halophilum TaxID=2053465 RepID=A0A2N5ZH75_MUIH1|nr:MAG: hypothetical protein C0601_05820 [Candidatus Muirbacterium halophilum]
MLIDFDPKANKVENKKKSTKKKKIEGKGFLDSLFSAELVENTDEVDDLIEDVDKKKENLKRERSFFAFAQYKKSVKKLVKKIKERNNIVKKASGKTILGKKELYVIQNVDKELEEMTRKMLQEEDVVYVLNKIDDVRGMVVDLYSG